MISLCMIAKNEADILARAIGEWRALADELIVVDTGSTDRTVAIAEEHGARVLHYEWIAPGNKGEARNRAIEAATGDWIIMLDADEVIEQPFALRAFMVSEEAQKWTAYNVTFHNFDEANRVTLVWHQIRIFQRDLYRYHHREHELPYPLDPQGARESTLVDCIFEHRPPTGRAPGKMQPMIDRLALDVEERPGDPHSLYFLHRQYALAGDWDRCIEAGRQYLEIAVKMGIDLCECYGNLASAYMGKGDAQSAINCLHAALGIQPRRRCWWIRMAEVYRSCNMANVALAYLRGAAELLPTEEPHGQPHYTGAYLYELTQACQLEQHAKDHSHG